MARTGQKIVATAEVWGWLTSFGVAAALTLMPLPSWLVDQVYSRGIYPILQTWITLLSNLVPFSLLDFLILTGIFLFFRRMVKLFGAIKTQGVLRVAWEGTRRTVRVGSIVVIAFILIWGLNYRRGPLGASPPPKPTAEALMTLMSDVNVLASRLRERREQVDMSFDGVAETLKEPMNNALMQVDRVTFTRHSRPKFSFMLTPFFTLTGVDGMIDPIALESIVHPDLLPFERPYALAHEWSHLAGIADEGEASSLGWLACMNGPPHVAYSGLLYILREAGAALPDEMRTEAFSRLDPGVRSDLVAIAQRLLQEHPGVQRAAFEIYDEYLKANHVEDGAASYGRALSFVMSSPFHDALVNYRFGK